MAGFKFVGKGKYGHPVHEKGLRDGNKVGKTSGLKLTHFLNELMAFNASAKLGDDELDAIVREEFPKRDVIQAMSAYRSYANAGKHGHIAPKGGAERYGAIVRKASPAKAGKGKGKAGKGAGKPAGKGKGKPAKKAPAKKAPAPAEVAAE